ncbi:MAG TPA: carbamoyltransferase HypF [Tepidisphaeraceae bacterium]|jgi:hydrogenase maturation protein HypF|nr:carbamoyltransferase HypF [Tepidisphaeraceae bacterium]
MTQRRSITVHGIVQGVGFRPFAYGLASRLGLGGFVRNQSGSVVIEIEGEADAVDQFLEELQTRPPPLAQINRIESEPTAVRGPTAFEIRSSETDTSAEVCLSPDIATCDECVTDLFDPSNRRFRYPFTNCTNCGPRLTIIKGAPYDRPLTTMASFEMCLACRAEYEDPRDRRFHAQPIACAACGPSLSLLDAGGRALPGDPLQETIAALRDGKIVAIKGLGGFHLACDANNHSAVRELRSRKHREEKAFAVMVRDLVSAEILCDLDERERQLLRSRARPIVLARIRAGAAVSPDIAPGGNPNLGLMLPYTPLHHLLMRDLGNETLVMTSGNRSDEPIAYENDDALRRLSGIADLFLTHNRPIHVRCDDSVTRMWGTREAPIRRSRGYAPQPIALPIECGQPILAVGGQLKATFALGRASQAIVSHHLGDLDELSAFRAFERDIDLYQQSFALHPRIIAHDLHPDYASTRYAVRRRAEEGARLIAVQHHHAHMASCMAEHGLNEPVIGVSFDGTGYGLDGAIWGGEFLVGDLRNFRRAAHLRYVPMPGGEKAIKEPWRMALAYLADAEVECPTEFTRRLNPIALKTARQAIERRFNAPRTSSAGRLFDAVASLTGVRDFTEYEGQAAIELEWRALAQADEQIYRYEIDSEEIPVDANVLVPIQIDARPLIQGVVSDVIGGVNPSRIASRFHTTLCRMIGDVCIQLRQQSGIEKVVLSGGVFMNRLLSEGAEKDLSAKGFCTFRHQRLPANDGAISTGQLAVAAKRLTPD